MGRLTGLIILIIFFATTASANIFGRDDRQIVEMTADHPLSGVGTLTNHVDAGRGTAFLVSRCHILSNFHVALSSPDAPDLEKELSTFTLLSGATSLARIVTYGDFDPSSNAEDWALLKLDTCLGETHAVLPLYPVGDGVLILNQMTVQLAGYPNDRTTDQLTIDYNCHIKDPPWRHDCATRPGNSGSPLLLPAMGGYVVVAITASSRGVFMELISEYTVHMSNGATPVAGFIDRIQPYLDADR